MLLKQVCESYDFVFLKNVTSRAWAGKTGDFDIWMAVLLLYILQNHLPQSLLNYDHPHTQMSSFDV